MRVTACLTKALPRPILCGTSELHWVLKYGVALEFSTDEGVMQKQF